MNSGPQCFLLVISFRTPWNGAIKIQLPQLTHKHAQKFGSLVTVDSVRLAINMNGHSGPDWEQGPQNSLS